MKVKLNQSLSDSSRCYVGVIGEETGLVQCPSILDVCVKVTLDKQRPTFSCLSHQLLNAVGFTGSITNELNCQYIASARGEYCACVGDMCNAPRKLSSLGNEFSYLQYTYGVNSSYCLQIDITFNIIIFFSEKYG